MARKVEGIRPNIGDVVFHTGMLTHAKVLCTTKEDNTLFIGIASTSNGARVEAYPAAEFEYSCTDVPIGAKVYYRQKKFIVTAHELSSNKLILAQYDSTKEQIRDGSRHAVKPSKVHVAETQQLTLAIVDEFGHVVERLGDYNA